MTTTGPKDDRREVTLMSFIGLMLANGTTVLALTFAILVPIFGWGADTLAHPLLVGAGAACVMAATAPRLFAFKLERQRR
jgi:hypothetical protein